VQKVPVIVERPGPERVITITKPVEVPVEVIKTEWPQVITLHVGSMLTADNQWVVPKFPDLVIGQLTPGAYAVAAQQPGWKIEEVRTETKLQPIAFPEPHVYVYPFGVTAGKSTGLVSGVAYRNAAQPFGTYEIRAEWQYPGLGLAVAWGIQW
jgi:hypothetical protein